MTKNSSEQEKINNLKSLCASIAHETRNPLSAIKSACELIRNNLEQAMQMIDLMDVASSRGLVVVEMILQNIKTGEIDKSKFTELSIVSVVENAIAEYFFENRQEIDLLNVNYENDFIFKGDETLMMFVVLNLLKNSLYYKAKINIWFDADRRCLYFKDEGVGIPADKLPYIFDDFFSSDKKGGTGLGLPFCKRVMRAFGGDISVKSEVGKGTEFCLRFQND